jgi:hypothetical protein
MVSDPIPANTSFVSLSQTSGPTFTLQTPAAGGAGTITLTIASMAPGQSAVFSIVVRVSQTPPGAIVNTATVTNAVNDTNQANNSASVSIGLTTPATVTPLPPVAPPAIPQVFQNPRVQGIFTSSKPSTALPVLQSAAEVRPQIASGPLVIHPPRTGDGGLAPQVRGHSRILWGCCALTTTREKWLFAKQLTLECDALNTTILPAGIQEGRGGSRGPSWQTDHAPRVSAGEPA